MRLIWRKVLLKYLIYGVINYQYDLFKDLKSTAERNGWTKNLVTIDEWWGDINQLRFGKVVGDELGLNPVFGALLSLGLLTM